MVMNGTSLYITGELLGHKTTQMTKRYSHLVPSTLRKAVNREHLTGAECVAVVKTCVPFVHAERWDTLIVVTCVCIERDNVFNKQVYINRTGGTPRGTAGLRYEGKDFYYEEINKSDSLCTKRIKCCCMAYLYV